MTGFMQGPKQRPEEGATDQGHPLGASQELIPPVEPAPEPGIVLIRDLGLAGREDASLRQEGQSMGCALMTQAHVGGDDPGAEAVEVGGHGLRPILRLQMPSQHIG